MPNAPAPASVPCIKVRLEIICHFPLQEERSRIGTTPGRRLARIAVRPAGPARDLCAGRSARASDRRPPVFLPDRPAFDEFYRNPSRPEFLPVHDSVAQRGRRHSGLWRLGNEFLEGRPFRPQQSPLYALTIAAAAAPQREDAP
jgi:hypothetical protein